MEEIRPNQPDPRPAYDRFGPPYGQMNLPNAEMVLVLGIISIVGCLCYGIVGIVLGIIALIYASKAERLYRSSPQNYTRASYTNLKTGKTCAIVGLCLSAVYFIIMAAYFAFVGTVLLPAILEQQ